VHQLSPVQILVEHDDAMEQTGSSNQGTKGGVHAWNLWKERCRRVFDNKGLTATDLQGLIVHDVAQWCAAWRCTAMADGEPE
jgi:hypothetical protein